MFLSIIISEQVQNKGQHNKSESNPLGELCQNRVKRGVFILGEEALGSAGNCTGQTGTFARLKSNNGDQSNSKNDLNDSENSVQNFHNSSITFKTAVVAANGRPKYYT